MKAKKLLSLGIAISMMVSALTACGNNATESSEPKSSEAEKSEVAEESSEEPSVEVEEEISLEGEELDIWIPIALTGKVMNYDESLCWQQIQENLGIKLNIISPAAGSEVEQFNVMLASDDMPDIILTGWQGINGLFPEPIDNYIEEGQILALNELIDEYCPNYKWTIENVLIGSAKNQVYTDKGNIAAFYPISPYEDWNSQALMINEDLLKQLDMEVPTTLAEYEEMFIAFRDELGVEAPLIIPGIESTAGMFISAYGIGPNWYREGDTIQYPYVQPAFKEYLTMMNRWYEEGILYADYLTVDDETKQRLLTTGELGAFFYSADTSKSWAEGYCTMVGGNYPVMNEGETAQYRVQNSQTKSIFSALITSACEKPEVAAKFLDYGYSEEGFMLYNYGIEGLTYERTDDVLTFNGNNYPKIEYTDVMMKNPDYTVIECIMKYKMHAGPFIRFENEGNPAVSHESAAIRKYMSEGAGTDLCIPTGVSLNDEERAIYDPIMSQVSTYASTAIQEFIMGIKSLDEFDEFVETIEGLNIADAQAAYQSAYDRYMTKGN